MKVGVLQFFSWPDRRVPLTEVYGRALERIEVMDRTGYDAVFNFASVPENIREIVDEETYGIRFEKRVPLQKLFGGLPEIGPVLDKFEEDQRIRRNLREGQFLTQGGTPATVPQFDESVIVGN